MSYFLDWSESSTGISLIENIAKLIMPGDSLLISPTSKGMISHSVSFSRAGRAGVIGSIDLEAEAVLEAGHNFRGAEMQAKGWHGDYREPVASVRKT